MQMTSSPLARRRFLRKRPLAASAAAAIVALLAIASPAQAHEAYWTHLKCVIGAGTVIIMDVSMTKQGVDGYSLITREDYATTPAFRADKVQLMLSPYDFNVPTGASHYGPFMTMYTWGDGSPKSVDSSFGSTALRGDVRYPLLVNFDLLKLKVTSGGTTVACQNTVGGGHS